MSDFECLKLNIHYRGDVSIKEQSFDYIGRFEDKDMLMDPDLMTWSIFEDFCKEKGVSGEVEAIWYKLPHEDISSARVIKTDKDGGIRELCREAVVGGEVDIYIDSGVREPTYHLDVEDEEEVAGDDGADSVDGNEECVDEAAKETNAEPQGVPDEGEDPVEERVHDDPRFEAFFAEVHNGTEATAEAGGKETHREQEETMGEELEDEEEFERQCFDADRPDPAMDTDEEWDAYDQAERRSSRKNYSKDKPPYLWIAQKFNSGEEFKDRLLRYVLKTNYDVKLCRWGATKLAAICRTCACNQWNLTGIPCPHAIYVITEHNRDPENYVDKYFLTTVWQANYKDNIAPVNGEMLWKKTGKGPIEVPDKRKKRGRPKKFARILEPGESATNPTKATREGGTVSCSNCKQSGYNKGTCKNASVQAAAPRKRGRPRKCLDNDDPWSINNAPKRWQQAQSQSTPSGSQSQSTPSGSQSQSTQVPQHSSAPAANPSGRGRARGCPPGTKNGEGKGRGKGAGKGRGKGAGKDEAPKPPIFFMSPWTDKVFDVWQPGKK